MEKLPEEYQKALEEYKSHLAARNLSESTRREYTNDISQLLGFLASKGTIEAKNIGLRELEAWLAELDKEGWTGTTRRRKTSSIKSFFGFLVSYDYIKDDISRKLIPPKREWKDPRWLTEEEYKRLENEVANIPKAAAIIELLLQTGIRLSELAKLTLNDVILPAKIVKGGEAGTLLVKQGKGRDDRILTLSYKACRAVKSWLDVRPDYGIDVLFISKFRKPITPGGFQWLVKKYLKSAGINGAHIHSLRHTFGTYHAKNGTNLRIIQEMLGHKKLDTTQIYISLSKSMMDEQIQKNEL